MERQSVVNKPLSHR